MEGGEAKDPKAADEETGQPEQPSDDSGGGRSFDCNFCKRGFSNAQALGGHMNIHRKERARMRPDPAPSEAAWYYTYPRRHRPFHPTASDLLRSFTVYFPESTSPDREVRSASCDSLLHRPPRPRELSLFREDGFLGLRLGVDIGGDRAESGEERRREREEGELDLELRLGHETYSAT